MNEEELFCKLFPEYVVNGKPLSPYFDLFENGYEQSENRIAELEKRCANYEMKISKIEKGTCDICKETEKDKKIAELEKENKTVSRKANEAIANKLLITAKYNEVLNDLNQENGKLQNENAELKEKLQKWKDEWQEQVQKATDEGYARTLQTIQLTKAKELLKWALHVDVEHTDSAEFEKKWAEAEQFLSEVEK